LRLKSLDIQGFKSFPDRTRLDFNDGITAVIGPNGSGKSNIADAIRWVLGEQSTRTLRGGKMEDVIFGGTQTRKPLGMASVTLNIDNADRALAGMDADEVSITRRLYRTGDSEYRINGAQVRLKDITELFLDTGLGRDGYSIIGQGRVAEIVSARSKERREIFEEAAGIAKFRYRKTEAERRLTLAEENLLRLRDILAELEGRLVPLRTQSEKAKQFLELAGEKKSLEVSVWMHTIGELRQKTAQLEDKLLLARSEHQAAEQAVAACERQYAEEQERGRALLLRLEEQRDEISRRNERAAGLEAQRAVLQNDISHHEHSIEEAKDAIEQAGRSQEELSAELAAAGEKLLEQKEKLAAANEQAEAIADQLTELAGEQLRCAAELDRLRIRRAGTFEAIEAARLDAAAAESLLGESTARIAAMESARAAREAAVEEAKRDAGECEGLLAEIAETALSLENSAKGYRLRRELRGQKAAELDQKLADFDRRINERRQRAKLLADMDRNMEGFGPSIKFVMGRARAGALPGVFGPVSSLITVEDGHTVAIETALGGAMQNIVVENEETGKRGIALLKESRAGRATFLPLTSVKGSRLDVSGLEQSFGFVGLACDLVSCGDRFRGVVTSLLGRVAVAEDIDSAVAIAKRNGYRFRIVTLDGQVVNAGGSMTGGYTAKSAGILGRQGEIERLEAEAKKLEEQRAQLAARREEAARELSSVEAELSAIAAQKKSCEEDRIRGEAELSAAKQRISQAERQKREADEQREQLLARIEEMKEKSGSSQEMTASLTAELDRLQRQIAEGGEMRDSLAARQNALNESRAEMNTAVALLTHEISTAEENLARLTALSGSAGQRQDEQREKIAALEAQIAAAGKQIEALAGQAAQDRREAEEAQQAVLETQRLREQSEGRCSSLRASEREESARRDNLYREVVRLDEQKTASGNECAALVAKLYDEYEMTQSDAEEQAQPVEDLAAANRRLAELRVRIKNLGSVNVDAIEEYREVSGRYEELSRQITDVEHSKTELSRLIGELTEQMRGIFSQQFEEINKNFGKIFTELFEGGSAALSLTDPDDLLESGIEITVRPPGKLIKNLAALSGGEQAFVAIAIFFAILKVNPSPFCLMDEIEAALDDVNVARFASYLHTLTEKTQFIAITHRRGTMEEADVLYGVTMQEEGVSKLLQLQVSEIEKKMGIQS